MNYDDIFLFVRLIDVGTFSGLAKYLGLTQGTVSRRIQNLEESMNIQLIRRNSRGLLEMTPSGELLYRKFSEQETGLVGALEEVLSMQDKIQGTLRIAVPILVYNKIILPYINNFYDAYPNVTLIVTYAGGQIELLKDGYDIGVGTEMPNSQNSKIKLLKKCRIKLYASPEYIKKYGILETIEDLPKHRIIGRARNNELPAQLFYSNLITGVDGIINYNAPICLNNANYNVEMAVGGHFIISALDIFAHAEVENKTLVPILPDYFFGDSVFYLIRSSGVKDKLERVFVEFIEDCFNKFKL